jgi:signal transduction histidine kinase
MNVPSQSVPPEDPDDDLTILVVAQATDTLSTRLGLRGLGVRVASSVADELPHLPARAYALGIVYVVDSGSEMEIMQRVQAHAVDTPLIVLASAHNVETQRSSAFAGFDVMCEPFNAEVLCAKVRTYLMLQRQQRELAHVRALYDADRRSTRQWLCTLFDMSSKLATCMTTDDVVRTFVAEAHVAVGAVSTFAYLKKQYDALELTAVAGIEPNSHLFSSLSLDRTLPVVAALRQVVPVWVSDGDELAARFPDLQPRENTQAVCALPFVVNECVLGAVTFRFAQSKAWSIDEREFFLTLVAAFVAAFERARLLLTERELKQELERRGETLCLTADAQAALALDNTRLLREAQRLTAELDKSNQELDQFAYVASHDLKAPLRGISNLSQWLEEDLGVALTPTAKGHLGLLRKRVQRLEGLIDGILNYSRAGRVRAKVEGVAVGKLIAEIVEVISLPTGARIDVQGELPQLRTERAPLQQVFMNLISNALKHAKRADVHVMVTAEEAGDFYEFSVEDNGIGIAGAFHERIWGIFQTLEPRDVVEGTGIGLSLVKKIVENQGGRVGVTSNSGEGARFWFTWPKIG